MEKIADIDKLFGQFAEKYIQQNKGKFTADEWEDKIPELYEKFGKTPFEELGGKTPETYFAGMSGKELVELLCAAAGLPYEPFAPAFVTRRGEECQRHLMAVACGLQSQILGEDQILSQVKKAAAIAREAKTMDAALETLFRTAASCGKAAKTAGRLTGVATSAAHQAVEAAKRLLGDLTGLQAMVIGNGEMGRLAAALLRDAGCDVTVTLRSYHHGETVVPAGCGVVPYDDRYAAMDGVDLVLSATTSPHYTVMTQPLM